MLRASLFVALAAAPVLAQANAVPGLDITMYAATDLGFYGRRGPAYPNGEAGFMVGHSWCNSGTVNLPWVSQSGGVMVDNYPRIAFLLARESGGRMVQITGQGHSKHSPIPFNFNSGPCLPCNPTGGAFFFVGCSDTYGAGTNSYQLYLGPNDELDPWLGTWNPQGSYFDRGDPPVTGPQAIDSVRSLTTVINFDPVKNRMVVREQELLAPGAVYYGQIQAVIKGEPVAARGNNVMNRQFSIGGTGGNWTTGSAGPSQFGSVLSRWSGATVDIGGNGTDDGRFVVAVKVTGPVGGVWHYEYAVHNLDNSRAGAVIRIPVDAAATVSNAGFRDIDANPLNDWTFARTATEITFTAAANNALEWNTFYNCWFDCSVAPSYGLVEVDEARPGAGAPSVQIASEVPSGIPVARKESVGGSCGSCTSVLYEMFATAAAFDLGNRSMTHTLNGGTYTIADTGAAFLAPAGTNLPLSDDSETIVTLPFSLPYPGGSTTQLRVCSNGFVSPAGSNGTGFTPSAAGLLGGQPRWAAAWHDFNPGSASSGPVVLDSSASEVRITWNGVNNFSGGGQATFQYRFQANGTVHIVWQAMNPAGNAYAVGWAPGAVSQDPGSSDLSATLAVPMTLCAVPFHGIALDASDRPVLGTTIQWQTTGIPAGTAFGALMRSLAQAVPPVDLTAIGMPGCEAHVVAPVATLFLAPGASVQHAEAIPNDPSLIGVLLVGQALIYSPPLTPLGLVASNGMVLTLGL